MATRTAPTVNGTPTWIQVSLTFYDYTGDQRTDTYQLDADATDIEIEAFVAATQALSNGTLWRVVVGQVYNSVGDPSNADELVWENIKDNVVTLMKTATNQGQDFYIPAPVDDMFLDGTETIDPSNANYITYLGTLTPVRAAYSVVSARFTHRRQIGSKINI